MARAGRFITFEGIDGSGKSTQARALAGALRDDGREVVLTREPGGSPGAEEIRRLLVEGEPGRWSPVTELLLFNAARRDHLERTIRPGLAAGAVVVSDRFADSTRVYQGVTRGHENPRPGLMIDAGLHMRQLEDAIHAQVIGIEPDLTFIIDMDPAEALARGLARRSGEDRFEDMGQGFQVRLREGFRRLAAEFPDRCVLIDGARPAEDVTAEVLAVARARL